MVLQQDLVSDGDDELAAVALAGDEEGRERKEGRWEERKDWRAE